MYGDLGMCHRGGEERRNRETPHCGPGYLSLHSETMLERGGGPVNLLVTPPTTLTPRTLLVDLGPLKVTLVRGRVKASCYRISSKFPSTHVEDAFQLTIETFSNYVSIRSGGVLRKLPCVVREDDFLTLGKLTNSFGGCVKPLF